MPEQSEAVRNMIRQLVIANRVLGNEGVLDAFGHVSVRHPERLDRYFLACSRSPQFVTEQHIMEFDLESNPIDQGGRTMYSERPIHGCLYQTRPDVMAVCHNHAHALLPFTVTGNPVRPAFHFAAAMGPEAPIWDIRDQFGDETNLLVTDNDRGRALAKAVGHNRVCLMRGHGSVVATHALRATVYTAVTFMQNAALVAEARKMGTVNYLSPGEVKLLSERTLAPLSLDRAWDYWCERAGFKTGDGA